MSDNICPVCKRSYNHKTTAPRSKFTLYELNGSVCFHTEPYTVEMNIYFHGGSDE